jgi:hypothetical protein
MIKSSAPGVLLASPKKHTARGSTVELKWEEAYTQEQRMGLRNDNGVSGTYRNSYDRIRG